MANRPTIKLLKEVTRIKDIGVATRWYDFGLELVNSDVLEEIKANHPNDVNTCCSVMFKKWLERDPDASWSKLVTALNNIEMKAAAASVIKLTEMTGICIVSCTVVVYLNVHKFSNALKYLVILAFLVFSLKLVHTKPAKCMGS